MLITGIALNRLAQAQKKQPIWGSTVLYLASLLCRYLVVKLACVKICVALAKWFLQTHLKPAGVFLFYVVICGIDIPWILPELKILLSFLATASVLNTHEAFYFIHRRELLFSFSWNVRNWSIAERKHNPLVIWFQWIKNCCAQTGQKDHISHLKTGICTSKNDWLLFSSWFVLV